MAEKPSRKQGFRWRKSPVETIEISSTRQASCGSSRLWMIKLLNMRKSRSSHIARSTVSLSYNYSVYSYKRACSQRGQPSAVQPRHGCIYAWDSAAQYRASAPPLEDLNTKCHVIRISSNRFKSSATGMD